MNVAGAEFAGRS